MIRSMQPRVMNARPRARHRIADRRTKEAVSGIVMRVMRIADGQLMIMREVMMKCR